MSKKITTDEMKQYIISILPDDATLVNVSYSSNSFVNMIVEIKQNGKLHTFITDKGEIYHNNTMLYDSSYQYFEKNDTFSKLIQVIKDVLV